MTGAALDVHDLHAGYGKLEILKGIDLQAPAGLVTAVVGANGAGKTTLLRSIMGLNQAQGSVVVGDRDLTGRSTRDRVRAGLVLVPEGRQLFPGLSVRENLLLGAAGAGRRSGRGAALEEVCELFPVVRERLRSSAGELSGGQQQMVAIGRALMAKPKVLLLDEPSQGLAPVVWSAVLKALRAIAHSERTVVIVEQRTADVVELASRTAVMRQGQIVLQTEGDNAHNLDAIVGAYMGKTVST
tara:strand:- start:660 stop:1385 length:726 start_codon:yes stop_codon:yes gene_type:complete